MTNVLREVLWNSTGYNIVCSCQYGMGLETRAGSKSLKFVLCHGSGKFPESVLVTSLSDKIMW